MMSAIMSDMNSNYMSPSNVSGICQTEMCTWEPYYSLGVCTSTEDISSETMAYQPNKYPPPKPQVSVLGPNGPIPVPNLPAQGDMMSFWVQSFNRSVDPEMQSGGGSLNNIPLIDTYAVYYPTPCDNSASVYYVGADEPSNWRAHHGIFSLCVQQLNSTFRNSTINTTILDTKMNVQWRANVSIQKVDSICARVNNASIDYCIARDSAKVIVSMLQTMLNASAFLQPDSDDSYSKLKSTYSQYSPIFVSDIMGSSPNECVKDPSYGYNGFQNRMRNIAIPMSNQYVSCHFQKHMDNNYLFRMRLSENATAASGTSWQMQQYIFVDLAWFSPPIVLYLGITAFLIALILQSRDDEQPIWKASTIALLKVRESDNGLEQHTMRKPAWSEEAKLQKDGTGWYLISV
jgi:hypothetical protein